MHFTAFESSLRGIRFQVQPVPPDARARQAAFTSVSLLVSVSAAPECHSFRGPESASCGFPPRHRRGARLAMDFLEEPLSYLPSSSSSL